MTTDEARARRLRVAVIGDGGIGPSHTKYELARELGALLIESGFAVVTGGLGGVMEAASRGARESSSWTPGSVVAILPGCDPADANAFADVVLPTGLDHVRNVLVAQADAVVAVGGGAGTLAEMAFGWIYQRPIVALRVEGWSGRLADQRLDERVRYPDIPEDRVYGADNAAQAVAIVRSVVRRYTRRHGGIRRRVAPGEGSERS